MAKKSKKSGRSDKKVAGRPETPQSIVIASRGIRTAEDGANFQAALIQDLMMGQVTAKTTNAACNAMGKLLKLVEMQLNVGAAARPLVLADPSDSKRADCATRLAELRQAIEELEEQELS